jgi:hypothetical protein
VTILARLRADAYLALNEEPGMPMDTDNVARLRVICEAPEPAGATTQKNSPEP